jgi:uncharacterized protein (DUF1697 family)
VNLGKQRKLPMPALRDALAAAGTTGARTYLQSGNIIIESPLRTHAQVSRLVRTVIAADFSLDVPVITRRPAHRRGASGLAQADTQNRLNQQRLTALAWAQTRPGRRRS